MTEYIVPYQDAESEFTEKRSRFITHLYKVGTEAEARARIEEMKKKYYDARHNCWCYLLQEGIIVMGISSVREIICAIPMTASRRARRASLC